MLRSGVRVMLSNPFLLSLLGSVHGTSNDFSPVDPLNAQVLIDTPESGWKATFIEARFADGFVATTPVRIAPRHYPTGVPPVMEPACKTLIDESKR